jgi:ketosteroid isomerase-like protein
LANGTYKPPITDDSSDVWGRVASAYDVRVDAERFVAAGPGAVVVTGRYRGAARQSAEPLDARFAHVLAIRDDRVSALQQFTDTRCWP